MLSREHFQPLKMLKQAQLRIHVPYISFFCYMCIMEKDPCGEIVFLTVLCDHPYLVSFLFSVLLYLHFCYLLNAFHYLFNNYLVSSGYAIFIAILKRRFL